MVHNMSRRGAVSYDSAVQHLNKFMSMPICQSAVDVTSLQAELDGRSEVQQSGARG